MDILFFLKHKEDVCYVYDDDTVFGALKKLEPYRFSAIPVITHDNKYVGTITEGDILWTLKKAYVDDINKLETVLIKDIDRIRDNLPINFKASMQTLLTRALDENFIPVLDDKERFLGIITRKEIISYFFEHNFIVL